MKRSIYSEMCEPSPLSRPPKPFVKLLTLDEFDALLESARDAIRRCVGTGALRTELVREGARTYSRPVRS